jgi:hypothetical protein
VKAFVAGLAEIDLTWHGPDFATCRDRLLAKGNRPANLSAHLSSQRAAYPHLLRKSNLRAAWFDFAGGELRALHDDDTPANRRAFVDEHYPRLQNVIDPKNSPVQKATSQNKADSAQVRLTRAQVEAPLRTPGVMWWPSMASR